MKTIINFEDYRQITSGVESPKSPLIFKHKEGKSPLYLNIYQSSGQNDLHLDDEVGTYLGTFNGELKGEVVFVY